MENTEIMMNEVMVDEVTETVAEPSGANFGKIGLGILAAGAVIALGYQVYKIVKAKKAAKKEREESGEHVIDVEDFDEVGTDE